ncbi:MAG: DUF2809 domain-containing protein [Oscillatoriophycideae cyanobacterium NC_groundwater_1537_Pr4_S-0.65um_50_18]|nr:DUF2809 domain-containing protein [Oscillatoriophycideae cyanobacterium NC_groundwater_1537_Pr4_S-0.65um_50_18]
MSLLSRRLLKYRLALLLSLVAIVPLGYWVRFAPLGASGLQDALGSVAYEIFWILLGVFLFPLVSPARVAITVGLATCAIEFLQLWQPPFLQALRATIPGRLVLGNTFSWADFPAYLTGSLVGWQWVKKLHGLISAA